jgi:hypothetical protein
MLSPEIARALAAYDHAEEAGDGAEMHRLRLEVRRLSKFRRMLEEQPFIGWNPALERVSDGYAYA